MTRSHPLDTRGTPVGGLVSSRLLMIKDQISKEDFDEDFFDVVCMWHVFEHLAQPKETLSIIKKILKPDGYLMMSLPNIGSVQSRLSRGKWLHLDPPKHLFFLERTWKASSGISIQHIENTFPV